jgi:hypothetical protein
MRTPADWRIPRLELGIKDGDGRSPPIDNNVRSHPPILAAQVIPKRMAVLRLGQHRQIALALQQESAQANHDRFKQDR